MRKIILMMLVIMSSYAIEGWTAEKPPTPTDKERLVLMPLRVSAENLKLQGAMEISLIEGLEKKYQVFAGERVRQKAIEIFKRENIESNVSHRDCDETRCMQDIAAAFQAELIAVASVTKDAEGYLLTLSITNIFDEKSVYSKSLPCKNCGNYQVVVKLKELTGAQVDANNDNDHLNWGIGFASGNKKELYLVQSSGNKADLHIDYDAFNLIGEPIRLRLGYISYKINLGADSVNNYHPELTGTAFSFVVNYIFGEDAERFRPIAGLGLVKEKIVSKPGLCGNSVGISFQCPSLNKSIFIGNVGFEYYIAKVFNFEIGYNSYLGANAGMNIRF